MPAPIVIDFTPEESERLKARAHAHRCDDPVASVRAFVHTEDMEDNDVTIIAIMHTICRKVLNGERRRWAKSREMRVLSVPMMRLSL